MRLENYMILMRLENYMIFYFDTFQLIVNVMKSGDYTTSRPFKGNAGRIDEQKFVEKILKDQTNLQYVFHIGVDKELWTQYKDSVGKFTPSKNVLQLIINDILFNPAKHQNLQPDGFPPEAETFKNTLISCSMEQQLMYEVGDILIKIRNFPSGSDDDEELRLLLQLEEKTSAYNEWVPDSKKVTRPLI